MSFVIRDQAGKKYQVRLEKNNTDIRIFLHVGKERHFVSVVEIDNKTCAAEIEEFSLVKGFKDFSRRGIGSEILRILEKRLSRMEVKTITGVIIKTDVDSAEFWRKQGFVVEPYVLKNDHIIYQIKKRI